MTVERMRCSLADVYPGDRWRLKCMQMPERQVVAIYKSLQRKNQLKRKPKKKQEPGIIKAVQITIFDLIKENENG